MLKRKGKKIIYSRGTVLKGMKTKNMMHKTEREKCVYV